ncbi:MAG: iron ABC transporter permease [Dehalococcoidia bacterium]|nr:iron ABC transporter permease [Dehalococcoidia bacterium]
MPEEKWRVNKKLVILVLGLVLLFLFIFSFFWGRFSIGPLDLIKMTLSRILNIFSHDFVIEKTWTDTMESIFFRVRMPRVALACLIGCALSVAGASYQGAFQNPMASPDILGASSGAAFGASLAILTGHRALMIMLYAFCFGLLTMGLVFIISRKARGKQIIGLILAGIMVSSLFSAATSYIKLVADTDRQLPEITYWLMGSLNGADSTKFWMAFVPIVLGSLVLFLLRWRINILTIGDEEAKTLGVNTRKLRVVIIIFATLLTAISVAVAGVIGWVGLVVPHLCRRLVGNNFRYLLPASMLFGASFLLLVDNISRNFTTTEIPLGILTAFVGAPFFIYLITRRDEVV